MFQLSGFCCRSAEASDARHGGHPVQNALDRILHEELLTQILGPVCFEGLDGSPRALRNKQPSAALDILSIIMILDSGYKETQSKNFHQNSLVSRAC